jgi:hypothetical protein
MDIFAWNMRGQRTFHLPARMGLLVLRGFTEIGVAGSSSLAPDTQMCTDFTVLVKWAWQNALPIFRRVHLKVSSSLREI